MRELVRLDLPGSVANRPVGLDGTAAAVQWSRRTGDYRQGSLGKLETFFERLKRRANLVRLT